jgi:Metalloenzyme superfamily
MARVLLIALDSVGIDPLGHDRADSVYSQSRFLFPPGGGPIAGPMPGALVETVVASDDAPGAIECAITYTSIFSGQSALAHHGLMNGLGMNEATLKSMVRDNNLFRRFQKPCLANAVFPAHLAFLGTSFVQDRIPAFDRQTIDARLVFDGKPVSLKGQHKHGFAELFTLGEINQNIFVFAAQEAGVALRTWDDVRRGLALTGTLTHELEARFNWDALDIAPLPPRAPEESARILARLAGDHDFTFYKYQLADLVSHTGQVELARGVFAVIETFLESLLEAIDPAETIVIVTSDHGHLEQVAFTRGHPKSRVPTWYFGPDAPTQAARMRTPEAIFHVVAEHARNSRRRSHPLRELSWKHCHDSKNGHDDKKDDADA